MDGLNPMAVGDPLLQMRSASSETALSAARSTAGHPGRSDEDLAAASRQFESLLLNMMIREMRATVPESALFPSSMAQELFTGMLDEKIAGDMAESGGIGISRLIFDQLSAVK